MKETMQEAGYRYVRFNRATGVHVLEEIATGEMQCFAANKGHASWGISWRNTDLEFCRSGED